MSILLRNIKIIDPSSAWHGMSKSLFVNKEGLVEEFENQDFEKEIDAEEMFAFPGLCDFQVNFCEPGLDYREDISSGVNAAAKGGVTCVLQVPNTDPIIDSKEVISFLKQKASDKIVDLKIICASSKETKGTELTEILEASEYGADAFGDGYKNIWHSGLLIKTLQYLKHTDKLLINQPYDVNLSSHGLMHEGVQSTVNGIPGIPSFVESMAIKRDLEILRYAGGKLHFAQLSTRESVELVREAKNEGLNVTCGVNYYHLIKTDEELADFDTNNKIMPPLRSSEDRDALVKGVKDGVIDVIVSNHRPQHEDDKKLEFNYAENGKIGVQTMFIALKSKTDLSDEDLHRTLVVNPRNMLGVSTKIEINQKANFFIFEQKDFTLNSKDILSKSKNTAEIGQLFKYQIVGTINGREHKFFN